MELGACFFHGGAHFITQTTHLTPKPTLLCFRLINHLSQKLIITQKIRKVGLGVK